MPNKTLIPFNDGYLPVGDGHALYFAEYGQADAPASIVLHGGPGSGCRPSILDCFDLAGQRVILFDQRGAGRSTPRGSTVANRTQDLVLDLERLRCHLSIAQWMVVGGSWGAALALCYAGQHPASVSGLVLRGVFLASAREMTWFFQSLRRHVPDGWDRLTAGWSASQKATVLQTLTGLVQSVAQQEQHEGARRWGQYEEAVMQAMMGRQGESAPFDPAWLDKYRIQAHYLSHACFVSERSLFRFARRASHLPAILLHGTRDLVCPPENVLRLQRFLPHAQVRWVEGGTHTPADPAIALALRQAIHDMQHQIGGRLAGADGAR